MSKEYVFNLKGDFPRLFEKYKPAGVSEDTYVRVIIESWLIDKVLEEEKRLTLQENGKN